MKHSNIDIKFFLSYLFNRLFISSGHGPVSFGMPISSCLVRSPRTSASEEEKKNCFTWTKLDTRGVGRDCGVACKFYVIFLTQYFCLGQAILSFVGAIMEERNGRYSCIGCAFFPPSAPFYSCLRPKCQVRCFCGYLTEEALETQTQPSKFLTLEPLVWRYSGVFFPSFSPQGAHKNRTWRLLKQVLQAKKD